MNAHAVSSIEERKQQALRRMEASRQRLIQRFSPKPSAGRPSAPPGTPPAPGAGTWVAALVARIERNGLVWGSWRTVRAVSRRWWTRQPWHGSAELLAGTLAREARPLVRRHPWASLAAAAAIGAALVAARPLISRSLHQHARPWRDGLGRLVWAQLTQAPVQLALAGALAAWLNELSQRPKASGTAEEP